MKINFAHGDAPATNLADQLGHFFQNPFAAFLGVSLIVFLFLIASLYVLDNFTSLRITNKKRG